MNIHMMTLKIIGLVLVVVLTVVEIAWWARLEDKREKEGEDDATAWRSNQLFTSLFMNAALIAFLLLSILYGGNDA